MDSNPVDSAIHTWNNWGQLTKAKDSSSFNKVYVKIRGRMPQGPHNTWLSKLDRSKLLQLLAFLSEKLNFWLSSSMRFPYLDIYVSVLHHTEQVWNTASRPESHNWGEKASSLTRASVPITKVIRELINSSNNTTSLLFVTNNCTVPSHCLTWNTFKQIYASDIKTTKIN